MATTSELSRGTVIRHNGTFFKILELEHRTPGNWRAMIMVKMKNLDTGAIVPERFNAGEKVDIMHTETRPAQYLYRDGDTFHFMDNENYEQLEVPERLLDENSIKFMRENDEVQLYYVDGQLISVEIPNFVELRVTSTEAAVRGDTATNVNKPATLETGTIVRVPAFVKEGDVIRIDTRTGDYMERVAK
jgi:elongation factor P